MQELILHHYDGSPFAEKARLMLGFKGLAWRSVRIPVFGHGSFSKMRSDEGAGTVHVHFPQVGFQIKQEKT